MTLHERIAEVLGWTVEDAQKFSLATLRELVRDKDPPLAQDIAETVRTGRHLTMRDP